MTVTARRLRSTTQPWLTSRQVHEADRIAQRYGPHRRRVDVEGRLYVDLLAYRSKYAPSMVTLTVDRDGRILRAQVHVVSPLSVDLSDEDLDALDGRVLDACDNRWVGRRAIWLQTGDPPAMVRQSVERLQAVGLLTVRRLQPSGNVQFRAV